MKNVFFVAGLLVLAAAPVWGADFQGAEAILKKMAADRQIPAEAKPADLVGDLEKKLADFRQQAPALPPEEAATRWLALFDAYSALPSQALNNRRIRYRESFSIGSFFQDLPPTAAWNVLAEKLEAKKTANGVRDRALYLLASILRGDPAGRARAMKDLRSAAEGSNDTGTDLTQMLKMMEEQLSALDGGDAPLAMFERALKDLESGENRRGPEGSLTVPALVRLAGRERAQVLLQRAMASAVGLEIQDKETRRLAVSIALSSIDRLRVPQWGLVTEIDDAPLFEAMLKRFPDKVEGKVGAAATVYLVSLIVNHHTKEAAQFAIKSRATFRQTGSILDSRMTDLLVRQGVLAPLRDVLQEVLSTDPGAPHWRDYIEVSARLGEPDRALAFLREVSARPGLSVEAQTTVSGHLVDALLAADEVEEGVKELRAAMSRKQAANADAAEALRKAGLVPEEAVLLPNQHGESVADRVGNSLRLCHLGKLLGRPEWVEEGLAAALAVVAGPRKQFDFYTDQRVLELLLSVGRGAEAEKIVSEAKSSEQGAEGFVDNMRTSELAVIYYVSGRYADVLTLLEQSPFWNAPDLAGLPGEPVMRGLPLLQAAAKALAVAGRTDEARRVVNRLLEKNGGYDPGYALLLELGGEGVEARLDELARRDRFEERPLIWKAKLQLDAGRAEEAEKTVQAAIAIDPSDGEEGKGDRMRAYAVLADILEKKGDAAQARIMRGAVEAIRLSENADDWWEAGLLRRAVKMYEEALAHFADAYCIQSRLALRYSELGDMVKAEQHYQRAFELMPESFGRIESHCFGCEGAFSGAQAQNIADRVFTKLAQDPGARPQVFYLLGYLRQHQDREAEAAELFQRAVRLDPDYFNAWEHLAETAPEGSPQKDEATLAMLRLDPLLHHHQNTDYDQVRDLRALWDAILAAEKNRPRQARGPLFPLPKAAEEVERKKKLMSGQGITDPYMRYRLGMVTEEMENQSIDLRRPISQHPAFAALTYLLQQMTSRQ